MVGMVVSTLFFCNDRLFLRDQHDGIHTPLCNDRLFLSDPDGGVCTPLHDERSFPSNLYGGVCTPLSLTEKKDNEKNLAFSDPYGGVSTPLCTSNERYSLVIRMVVSALLCL